MFKYVLFKLGHFLVNILPLRFSYLLAQWLCECHYLLSVADRKAVANNLRIIMGERDDFPVLTREVFHNFGRYLVEFFRLKKILTDEFIRDYITVEHIEHIQNTLAEGKGAIILTAHLGNWELGGALLGHLGYPLTIIALPHSERSVNSFFNLQRERHGNKVVQTNQAIRVCTDALKNKELVAIAADRDFSNSGEVMEFFGHKTILPKGAAVFSLKLDVPIIPTFLIREGQGRFRLTIEKPIAAAAVQSVPNEKERIYALMRIYLRVIEGKIRQYPTQWLMFREFSVQ
ncbi:MAG TPA: lysophospholipid acyltransferase family protein [Candidatus Omnitrophota bacterium]|nr:lysophospholipid acyltransferase family protein [Candidatus Omnitrophota bacterium]